MPVLDRWRRYLTDPVDGASLAVFRMAFGAIMLWEVLRYAYYGRIERYYIEPKFFFSYLPFVTPWPGVGMYLHFAALGVLAILIAAGLFYRVASALFCLGFTYVFLLDKAQYLNHLYLICLISFLLALTPAHRVWSLDRRLGRVPGPETVPRFCLLVLRTQIALVYFFGGIAKLNADWLLRAEPIGTWLGHRSDLPVIGPLLALPASAFVFAYAGLAIDLSLGVLLALRRTFPIGAAIAVLFNITNAIVFSIGIFPYFMIASLGLFPDPGWPRGFEPQARWLRAFVIGADEEPGALTASAPDAADSSPADPAPARSRRAETALLALLHAYMLIQIALPFRHWFYPGDVAWNEEGHRFSWRMKLRDKDVDFAMFTVDPRTGRRQRIRPNEWLTERQVEKMVSRPDMITQLARHVADRREAETGVRPIINAQVTASLNRGERRPLIDPALDLASRGE